MRIKRTEARCEGDKRQKVPFIIEWDCPKCLTSHTKDLSGSDHLSYPVWGEAKKTFLYCDECEHEEPVMVKAEVTLTISPCTVVLEDMGPVCVACDYPLNAGYPADDGTDERCPVCGAPC